MCVRELEGDLRCITLLVDAYHKDQNLFPLPRVYQWDEQSEMLCRMTLRVSIKTKLLENTRLVETHVVVTLVEPVDSDYLEATMGRVASTSIAHLSSCREDQEKAAIQRLVVTTLSFPLMQ